MKPAENMQVTTPSDLEIVVTRAFNAPRRLVWDAMTKPELIKRWLYAPPGWLMTVCEGEVREGGTFRWAWNGPDGRQALTIYGEHREVLPPERLVHTEEMEMGGCPSPGELIATLVLTEQAGRTTMHMTMLFPSKEARDGALASGMDQGMSAGYTKLDEVLATMQA